jgi:hypothetical protein
MLLGGGVLDKEVALAVAGVAFFFCFQNALELADGRTGSGPARARTKRNIKIASAVIAVAAIRAGLGYAIEYSQPRTLHEAVASHDVERIRRLISEDVDVNARDVGGDTALHLAIRIRRFDIVKMLMANGADPTLKDGKDRAARGYGETGTALHRVVLTSDLSRIWRRVNLDPYDVNAQDVFGDTPLHYAAERQDAEIVALLLLKLADPDVRNCVGKRPIDYANEDALRGFQIPARELISKATWNELTELGG